MATSLRRERFSAAFRSWAAYGAVASLAQAACAIGVRLWFGGATLAETIQESLLTHLPGAFVSRVIDRLQLAAKPVTFVCLELALLVLWTVLALSLVLLLPARLRTGGQARYAAWIGVAEILFGTAMQGAALAALGWRPNSALALLLQLLPNSAFGMVMGGACWLGRPNAGESRSAAAIGPGRRGVLVGLGVTLAAAASAGVWDVVRTMAERGSSGGALSDALAITPNEQFYIVSKNAIDPDVQGEQWRLELKRPGKPKIALSYNDVLALPAAEQDATLECISNGVGGALISTASWRGAPLAAVLDLLGPVGDATWVVFTSADGYQQGLPLDVALRPTTLLAYGMNGEPLPQKHGFPLRVLAPGRYGMKNPKWLTRIELAAEPFQSYWERTGWDGDRGVETMVRFVSRPRTVALGGAILLHGVAYAGDRGVSSVDLSFDAGRTWLPAPLEPPLSALTWRLWSYVWQPARSGKYVVTVRAADGAGQTQASERHYPFPTGATGYDEITPQAT